MAAAPPAAAKPAAAAPAKVVAPAPTDVAPKTVPVMARFFGSRVGMLNTWSKRVFAITKQRFLAYDETDILRESYAWTQLSTVVLSAGKTNEFTMQFETGNKAAPFDVVMYICEYRDHLLSMVHKMTEDAKTTPVPKFACVQLSHADEPLLVVLSIGGAFIEKLLVEHPARPPRLISARFIYQIVGLINFEHFDAAEDWREYKGVLISYADDTYRQYLFNKSEERSLFIATIRKALQENFGRNLVVVEMSAHEIKEHRAKMRIAMRDAANSNPPIYETSVTRLSPRVVQPKPRKLRLTVSHLVVEEDNASKKKPALFLAQQLQHISCLRADPIDPQRFQMQFSSGRSMWLTSADRDTVIANVLELARLRGNTALHLMFHDAPPGSKVNPPNAPLPPDWTSYLVRRALLLTPKSDPLELAFTVCEFNNNVPLSDANLKDKQLANQFFALLKSIGPHKSDTESRKLTIALLLALQRCLFFRGNFEIIMSRKDYLLSIFGYLKSNDTSTSCAAATLLLSMLNPSNPNVHVTALNKNLLFTDEGTAAVLAVLMRNSEERANPLLVSTLLAILELVLHANVNTTSPDLLKVLVKKFQNLLETFFDMCKYDCVPIARVASVLLDVLMRNHEDAARLNLLQNVSRTSTALLWQLRLAVSSPVQEQRRMSQQLVSLMVEGNFASMSLFDRLFPAELTQILRTQDASPTIPAGKKPAPDSKPPGIAPKWERFFATVEADAETPNLVWNTEMRLQLVHVIDQEMFKFNELRTNYRSVKKCGWNGEELRVKYKFIADEEVVQGVYLSRLIKQVDTGADFQVALPDANAFVDRCFLRLLMERDDAKRVLYLRSMTWCYSKHSSSLKPFRGLENFLQLLPTWTHHDVVGYALFFLTELVALPENYDGFVALDGCRLIVDLLPVAHEPHRHQLHPHRIGLVCLKLLHRIAAVQSNVDSDGSLKLPLPSLKRILSEPTGLGRLVQLFVMNNEGFAAQMADATILMVEYVLDFDENWMREIYKTGLLFFLLRHVEHSPTSMAELIRLLHRVQAAVANGQSFFAGILPSWLIKVLDTQGSEAFLDALRGEGDAAERASWTAGFRRFLDIHLDLYLLPFRQALAVEPRTLFEYTPMPPVPYPPSREIAEAVELAEQRLKLETDHYSSPVPEGAPLAASVVRDRSVLESSAQWRQLDELMRQMDERRRAEEEAHRERLERERRARDDEWNRAEREERFRLEQLRKAEARRAEAEMTAEDRRRKFREEVDKARQRLASAKLEEEQTVAAIPLPRPRIGDSVPQGPTRLLRRKAPAPARTTARAQSDDEFTESEEDDDEYDEADEAEAARRFAEIRRRGEEAAQRVARLGRPAADDKTPAAQQSARRASQADEDEDSMDFTTDEEPDAAADRKSGVGRTAARAGGSDDEQRETPSTASAATMSLREALAARGREKQRAVEILEEERQKKEREAWENHRQELLREKTKRDAQRARAERHEAGLDSDDGDDDEDEDTDPASAGRATAADSLRELDVTRAQQSSSSETRGSVAAPDAQRPRPDRKSISSDSESDRPHAQVSGVGPPSWTASLAAARAENLGDASLRASEQSRDAEKPGAVSRSGSEQTESARSPTLESERRKESDTVSSATVAASSGNSAAEGDNRSPSMRSSAGHSLAAPPAAVREAWAPQTSGSVGADVPEPSASADDGSGSARRASTASSGADDASSSAADEPASANVQASASEESEEAPPPPKRLLQRKSSSNTPSAPGTTADPGATSDSSSTEEPSDAARAHHTEDESDTWSTD